MIVLGIDPGYGITGYGVIYFDRGKFKPVEYGAVTTPKDMAMPDRLQVIYERISAIIKEYRPDALAIEKLFFNTNAKTVIDVGQARGVVMLAGAQNDIRIAEYTPLQVKQAVVGYGRAEKKQVQYMVTKILNLEETPKPDDTADALAIAICHCQWNVLESMTRKE